MALEEKLAKLREIQAHVRALAAEHPVYVYVYQSRAEGKHPCLYAPTETNPMGCIAGAAARRAGVDLTVQEGQTARAALRSVLALQWGEGGDLLKWIDIAQDAQDGGASWSEAVRQADEFFSQGPGTSVVISIDTRAEGE